jgi:hypothetical protein
MYAVECHSMVFPKYAKLVFKINQSGNMTISASPSFTPGTPPAGMENGQLPKGTRVFDYSKEILVSIGFSDCLSIIKFAENRTMFMINGKGKRIDNKVDIFRNSAEYNKHVTFIYTPDDVDPNKIKMCTIFFDSSINGNSNSHIKFYLPLALSHLDEIAELCKAYAYNVTVIKTMCALENIHYPYVSEDRQRKATTYKASKEDNEKTEQLKHKYESMFEE